MLELDSWAQDVTQHTAQEGQLPYPPPQSGPQANVRVDVARMTRNASERFMVCTFRLVLISILKGKYLNRGALQIGGQPRGNVIYSVILPKARLDTDDPRICCVVLLVRFTSLSACRNLILCGWC